MLRSNVVSRRRIIALIASAGASALAVACGQAPAPTQAPTKPAEPTKPAVAAAQPTPAPQPSPTVQPTVAPKPTVEPAVAALPAPSKSQVNVRIMAGWPLATGGPHPVTKKQMEPLEKPMAKFTEQFPNIKVQWAFIPDLGKWEKMGTDLVGAGNDVYYANSHDYMPGGPIELLDPWYKRDKFSVEEFIPGYDINLYAYTYDTNDKERHHYSMPLLLGSSPMLFYDQEILGNYGVEPPSEKPTLEEILEKAKKLTGKDPKTGRQTYGFYLPSQGGEFAWVSVMNSYGGELFDDFEKPTKATVNTEAGKKAMAWWVEMAKYAGPKVLAHAADLAAAPEFLSKDNPYAMGVGRPDVAVAAISLGLSKRIGARIFFKNKEGKGGNPGGIGLMMHRASKVKGDAWELMKFLQTDEMHRWRWVNWAFFSTRKVAATWPDVKEEPMYDASYKQLASGKFMPTKRIVKWRVAVMPYVQAAISGQKSQEQALQEMEKDLTGIISAPGP